MSDTMRPKLIGIGTLIAISGFIGFGFATDAAEMKALAAGASQAEAEASAPTGLGPTLGLLVLFGGIGTAAYGLFARRSDLDMLPSSADGGARAPVSPPNDSGEQALELLPRQPQLHMLADSSANGEASASVLPPNTFGEQAERRRESIGADAALRRKLALCAAVATAVGAMGPWMRMSGLGAEFIRYGWENADGVIMIVLAGAAMAALLSRFAEREMLALACFALSALTAWYDFAQVSGIVAGADLDFAVASVAWGLPLALIASVAGFVLALMARAARRQASLT